MNRVKKYNLHNHTYLCKHASGSARDMVRQAMKDGYEIIGISDHIAYPTKATRFRMEYEEKEGYLQELKQLQHDYQDNIKVLRGFEAEYQREYLYQLVDLFSENKIEYLTLGQHYQDINNLSTYYGQQISQQQIKLYVDQCIEAMQTGLFLFVAHPDLFMNNIQDFDDFCYEEAKRLMEAAIKYNVYLEYNAGGVRYGTRLGLKRNEYPYPRLEFWQLARELKVKVIVNSDAHSPQQITDAAYLLACQQANDLGLDVVEELDLSEYQQKVMEFVTRYNEIRKNGFQ